MSRLDAMDEEFSNFMYKVTEVSNIVGKLASNDKSLQQIGDLEAQQYLGEDPREKERRIDEHVNDLRIKCDRTLINKVKDLDPATKSQEAFMDEVSKDADKRYKDKLVRRERMETFKTRANLAFRRGDYTKALSCYNKAIEQIRDSCMLYTNRALTYVKLEFYDKAVEDCELALRLYENSLKARLLLAKAHYLRSDVERFRGEIDEARARHGDELDFIEDYVRTLTDK